MVAAQLLDLPLTLITVLTEAMEFGVMPEVLAADTLGLAIFSPPQHSCMVIMKLKCCFKFHESGTN